MRKILLSLAVSGVLAFASERALISDDYSNYFSTAKEIPLNTTINGELETVNDIDIFKFSINEDDGINIYTTGSYGQLMELYIIKQETINALSNYLNEENWDIESDVKYNIKNVLYLSIPNKENKESLNMSAGNYYLIVMWGSAPYTFRIESTENNGSVSLDKVTLEYCKTHLEECGISVNSELKYTQSDLDSAVSSAKEEGKTEAKNELKLSKEKIESLSSGWSLLGSCQSEEDKTIFNSAESVWSYENGNWSHNPNELKAFSGFWIKK